jgi:hypothetical protein
VERPGPIADDESPGPGRNQQPRDPQSRRARPVDDDPGVLQALAHQRERILKPGQDHHPRPVGVVVEDRDVHGALQVIF